MKKDGEMGRRGDGKSRIKLLFAVAAAQEELDQIFLFAPAPRRHVSPSSYLLIVIRVVAPSLL
jgi:hypothetical protein